MFPPTDNSLRLEGFSGFEQPPPYWPTTDYDNEAEYFFIEDG